MGARRSGPSCLFAGLLLAAGGAMADWVLEREEVFSAGRPLDRAWWRHETGFHRNREEQYYAERNVAVQDGVLRIEARREEVPNAQWRAGARGWQQSRRSAAYTSGSIVSQRPPHYGRIEVVARAPSGAGVWPAIWLLHEDRGVYGEIDLFEAVGKHPDTVFAGVHWGSDPASRKHHNASRVVPGFEGRWHTHTLEWTPAAIVVSLDGEPWFRFDPAEARLADGTHPLRKPMRLRINLALGGSWGGPVAAASVPARFEIRSVRIWRYEPAARAAAPAPAAAVEPAREAAPAGEAPAVPGPAAPPTAPFRWGR